MTELHTRLRDSRESGATLKDVAEMLGISEYEARTLLVQVRNDSQNSGAAQYASPSAPKPWLKIGLVAIASLFVIVCVFGLMARVSRPAESVATSTPFAESAAPVAEKFGAEPPPAVAEVSEATTAVAEKPAPPAPPTN